MFLLVTCGSSTTMSVVCRDDDDNALITVERVSARNQLFSGSFARPALWLTMREYPLDKPKSTPWLEPTFYIDVSFCVSADL